jgi:hypothetical protein
MRRHPVDGAEILEEISGLKDMAQIVRYHQEAYDGSGYPEGLKGEQIPVGARIATVVDAFDAMITDRPYRKGMPIERAIEELKRNRGTQFDPKVVDAILALYEDGNLRPVHLPEPANPANEQPPRPAASTPSVVRSAVNHRPARTASGPCRDQAHPASPSTLRPSRARSTPSAGSSRREARPTAPAPTPPPSTRKGA